MKEAIRQGDIPGVQLRRRLWLAGRSRDDLWPWLTKARLLALWLADEASGSMVDELELRTVAEGATIVELLRAVAGENRERGTLELEHRRVDWRTATRLTFALTSQPDGCEISVLHQGFQALPLSDCLTAWEAYRSRWARAFDRLEQALEAG